MEMYNYNQMVKSTTFFHMLFPISNGCNGNNLQKIQLLEQLYT